MRTYSVQNPCAAGQAVTQEQVHDHGSQFGLTAVGEGRSEHCEVREVAWLVEDWRDLFNQRCVSWRTLVTALAGDAQIRDMDVLDDLYSSKEDYRYAAEWRLMFVLNHLEGSGLRVVRMPS